VPTKRAKRKGSQSSKIFLTEERKIVVRPLPWTEVNRRPESELVTAAKVTLPPRASENYAAAFARYYARGTAFTSNIESTIGRNTRLISENPLR
jgi:hypothetical protein